jgi:DNA-binding GntR family transcriptional regulator
VRGQARNDVGRALTQLQGTPKGSTILVYQPATVKGRHVGLLASMTAPYNSFVPASNSRRPKPRPAASSHRPTAPRTAAAEPVDNVTRVYTELRALIIAGQLPPGARIAERAVVARMGLSRTPVRSALHRLQQEGFVASVGRAGDQRLIVTPLTRGDGREVFLIVGHLEGLAASEAASLPADRRRQLVAKLREVNRELALAAKNKASPAKLFDLDLQFHDTYVDGVAGPRVVSLHRAIKPQSERYARLYVNVLLDELPTSVKEHEAIAAAIAKGDRRAAQNAVETNWQNAAVRLSDVIAEHGERGSWHLWDGAAEANGTRPSERRT